MVLRVNAMAACGIAILRLLTDFRPWHVVPCIKQLGNSYLTVDSCYQARGRFRIGSAHTAATAEINTWICVRMTAALSVSGDISPNQVICRHAPIEPAALACMPSSAPITNKFPPQLLYNHLLTLKCSSMYNNNANVQAPQQGWRPLTQQTCATAVTATG